MKKLGFILLALLTYQAFALEERLQVAPKVELLHTADPFDGTFKNQLQLPINMTGKLYFRVLNIENLKGQQAYLLFSFRNDSMRIILPAMINTAPGISSNLEVEYLGVHMQGQPFLNIKHRPLMCSVLGRCPETTKIEIVTRNPNTGLLRTHASSSRIKIRFHNASNNNRGKEILFTEYRSCFSSMDCSNGNCCYNGHCWSRSLAGQCLEDTNYYGQPPGQGCSSHYECHSLCCDSKTRSCSPMEDNNNTRQLCNQTPGSLCIDKTWCQEETVKECKIIKTGNHPKTGAITCELWCYDRKEHGDCLNHRCQAPMTPPVPYFDPLNPNCAAAVDPSSLFD